MQGILRRETAEQLYAESGAAEFGLSCGEFAGMLEGQNVQSLRVKDLVLARGCARGNEKAWECFMAGYRGKMYRAAAAIARDEQQGRELADWLYGELYGVRVEADGRRLSRLESFGGRGSLEGWLKTILAQEYVNRLRRQRKFVAFDDELETPVQGEAGDPGAAAQREALARATDAALAALGGEDRFVLAAYYLDGRTLAEIGRMLGTHESTVSRKVDKITAGLRKQIVARLCKEGWAKRAAEEMLELDVRDLGVNMREKLAQERGA